MRPLRELVISLLFDFAVTGVFAWQAMSAWTARQYTAWLIECGVAGLWLFFTWRNLDRWTGPAKKRR